MKVRGSFGVLPLLLWSVAAAGCSGSPDNATAPTPPDAAAAAIGGTVTRVLDGTPIPGATITAGSLSAQSDAAGHFHLPGLLLNTRTIVSINAPGYTEREMAVRLTGDRAGFAVSLIPAGPPFNLDFYRWFARDGVDNFGNLQGIRRWTTAPSFYIRTVVREGGQAVQEDVIERVKMILASGVSELSGGAFSADTIETGVETRDRVAGWVNVEFVQNIDNGYLGLATVGGNSGIMELKYDPDAPVGGDSLTGCDLQVFRVTEHEVTHTMGGRHTPANIVDFQSVHGSGCVGMPRPDHVRYHTAVMYTRQQGNLDIDRDLASFLTMTTQAVEPPVVTCRYGDIY